MQSTASASVPIILKDLLSGAALEEQNWQPFRLGIEIRWIYKVAGGCSAALLRYEPGASLDRHIHMGYEHIFVLKGSQTDDNGEHCEGTLVVHPPGTNHAVHSREGCIVLAIWERAVHISPAGLT